MKKKTKFLQRVKRTRVVAWNLSHSLARLFSFFFLIKNTSS